MESPVYLVMHSPCASDLILPLETFVSACKIYICKMNLQSGGWLLAALHLRNKL